MVIIVGFGLLRLLGAPVLSGLTGVQPIHRLTTTTSSGRFEIWKTGLVACKLHCGAGSGLGTFEAAYNEAFALTSISRDVGFNRPAHDVYLDLVVETGFLGLTLFLLAMASEWVHFGSAPMLAVSPAFRAAIVGVLIANVFLSAIWFKYFWLPLVVGRVIEGAAASWERDRSLEPGAAPSPDLATALT